MSEYDLSDAGCDGTKKATGKFPVALVFTKSKSLEQMLDYWSAEIGPTVSSSISCWIIMRGVTINMKFEVS